MEKYIVDVTYKTGGKGTFTETYFANDIATINKLFNNVILPSSYRHKNIKVEIIETDKLEENN